MVENKITTLIEFVGRSTGMKQISKDINTLGKQTTSTSKILQQAGLSAKQAFDFKELGIDNASASIKGINKTMYKFDARMLSSMFFMMALQRVALGFFRTMFGGMRDVLGDQHAWSIATDKLSAAFTFLKFSMIEVLSQSPLFQSIVNWLVRIIQGVAEWVQQHPKLTAFIVVIMGIVAALATLGLIISMVKLGFMASFGKGGVLGVLGLLFVKIKALGILILGLNWKGMATVAISAMKAIGRAIFMSPLGAWLLLIVAILMVFVLFANLKKQVGSLGNAFRVVIHAWRLMFLKLFDDIDLGFQRVINGVLKGFNWIAGTALGKFLGIKPIQLTIDPPTRAIDYLKQWETENAALQETIEGADLSLKSLLDPSVLLDPFKGLFGGEETMAGGGAAPTIEGDVLNVTQNFDVNVSPGADTTDLNNYFNEMNDVFRSGIDNRFGVPNS